MKGKNGTREAQRGGKGKEEKGGDGWGRDGKGTERMGMELASDDDGDCVWSGSEKLRLQG